MTPLGSSKTPTHTRKMSRWGFCRNLDATSSQGDNKSCSRFTILIGWTGNIQEDDRFLSKNIRLWPQQFNCILLFIPSQNCLACRFNLFFWVNKVQKANEYNPRWQHIFWQKHYKVILTPLFEQQFNCTLTNTDVQLWILTFWEGEKVTFKMITNII